MSSAANLAASQAEFFTAVGNLAGANLARRAERRADAAFDERQRKLTIELDAKYEAAVRRAAITGDELPSSMQATVPVDQVIGQVAVKVVALRELRRYVPTHPLVCLQGVRQRIAREARKIYNVKGRPLLDDVATSADDMAPSDQVSKLVFASGQ